MLCKNISYLKDELRPLNSLMFDVSVGKLQIKLIHSCAFLFWNNVPNYAVLGLSAKDCILFFPRRK